LIQIRLREKDAKILVEALRSCLIAPGGAPVGAGRRESSRSRQARQEVLESFIRHLTARGSGSARRLPRGPSAVFEPRPATLTGRLTQRQQEVLRLVARGRSSKQIAQILAVSIKTVEFHRARITKTLGIRTIAELTRYALAHGMAEP
jgi:DNA-binding NarL/FixJ family response regulator